jgi:hypothetical protein
MRSEVHVSISVANTCCEVIKTHPLRIYLTDRTNYVGLSLFISADNPLIDII